MGYSVEDSKKEVISIEKRVTLLKYLVNNPEIILDGNICLSLGTDDKYHLYKKCKRSVIENGVESKKEDVYLELNCSADHLLNDILAISVYEYTGITFGLGLRDARREK